MSAPRFTPGPWRTYQEAPGSSIRIYGRTEHGEGCIGSATCLADARLFAAAPEMLQALRDAEHELSISAQRDPQAAIPLACVRDAIAKAVGR